MDALTLRNHLVVFAAAFSSLVVSTGLAQNTGSADHGAEVAVQDVSFRVARPASGGAGWLEALVELDVRAGADGGVYARYADRVQVTLSLSVRKRNGEFEFYRASAEAVSVEAGRAAFRFYLPPEIVQREQINTDPYAWMVEVSVRGRPAGSVPATMATVLRSAEALRSFRDRIAQAAPLNDGVLVPQYDSPFAGDFGRDTPSFVRRNR